MKSFKIFSIVTVLLVSANLSFAQVKKESFKVSGECGMCKSKIEKAAKEAGATYAVWSVDKKVLTVKYNSSSTNTAKIQEAVAKVGYDTPKQKASDEAYNSLHGCCKYERSMASNCCIDGKCSMKGTDDKDCCKDGTTTMECCVDGKCSLEGQDGKDCCKVGEAKMKENGVNGVKVGKTADEVVGYAQSILGGTLVTIQTGPAGKVVNKVLIAQDMYFDGPTERKEFYLSILLDRTKGQNVIMYSTEGGMNIEDVAHKTPEKIFKELVHPSGPLQGFQARKIAFNLGLSGEAFKSCVRFVTNLYNAYIGLDCSMLEINPLFKDANDKIIAVDCKMNLDDNALMRHPDLAAMRDTSEEDPTEVEAGKYNLNFVKLDGNVGCMVNGAGLAMATMDMIQLSGGEPANFLDVGGTANAQTVEAGFKIILKDPNVKAILINIFGGIVRCDRVAQGVIDAYKNMKNIKVPIIVRLQGTNAEEAKKLIDESGLKVQSAILLSEAAELVKKAVA